MLRLLWTSFALLFLLLTARPSSADEKARVLVVEVVGAASEREQRDLRRAAGDELGVTAVAPDDPRAADARGRLVVEIDSAKQRGRVTYRDLGEPIQREIALDRDPESARRSLVLLAGNVARDEAAALVAPSPKESSSATLSREHAPEPNEDDTSAADERARTNRKLAQMDAAFGDYPARARGYRIWMGLGGLVIGAVAVSTGFYLLRNGPAFGGGMVLGAGAGATAGGAALLLERDPLERVASSYEERKA